MTAKIKPLSDQSTRQLFLRRARDANGHLRYENEIATRTIATLAEFVALSGVPAGTVRRWCDEGVLVARQTLTGKHWLISLPFSNAVLSGMFPIRRLSPLLLDDTTDED